MSEIIHICKLCLQQDTPEIGTIVEVVAQEFCHWREDLHQ